MQPALRPHRREITGRRRHIALTDPRPSRTPRWPAQRAAATATAQVATPATVVGSMGGVWKSTDGGATWTNTTSAAGLTSNEPYSDLVMDPSNSSILYTAIGDVFGATANGVYKTTNAGSAWAVAGDFPTGTTNGRIAL